MVVLHPAQCECASCPALKGGGLGPQRGTLLDSFKPPLESGNRCSASMHCADIVVAVASVAAAVVVVVASVVQGLGSYPKLP